MQALAFQVGHAVETEHSKKQSTSHMRSFDRTVHPSCLYVKFLFGLGTIEILREIWGIFCFTVRKFGFIYNEGSSFIGNFTA